MMCPRCRSPLTADADILADAQRQGITLDFLPLRCRNGHSARLPRPRPRMRFVPICRFCDAPVLDRSQRGKQLLNHAACVQAIGYDVALGQPGRYVEVKV